MSDVHVIHRKDGWAVRQDGRPRAKTYATKDEAVKEGRRLAREHHAEHIIHNRDGRIVERDSYGRDPFPPGESSSKTREDG